jgi:hypothetical protein
MTRTSACAEEDRHSPSRRDVLAVLGLGTAAVVGTQLPRSAASAADGDALLLGQTSSAASETRLEAGGVGRSLVVANVNAGHGIAVVGEGTGDGGCGVLGSSEHSVGVFGESLTGEGGRFTSQSGTALKVEGAARVMGKVDDNLAVIENVGTGGGLSCASSGGGAALFAIAIGGDDEHGWRMGGTAIETRGKLVVEAKAHREDPSGGNDGYAAVIYNHLVDPTSGGLLVVQPSGSGGPAVDASCPGGIGLRVSGTARFSTCGSATLPANSTSVAVDHPSVTSRSHVTVTFVTDPGTRSVSWVDRTEGGGFTVHVTPYKGRSAPELTFTYLVVEPAW